MYWQHKARSDWHNWGDLNSNFFHMVVKVRRSKGKIIKVVVDDGTKTLCQSNLKELFTSKFRDIMGSMAARNLNAWC